MRSARSPERIVEEPQELVGDDACGVLLDDEFGAGLSAIAAANSPFAAGTASSASTDEPPALSPNTVTLSASPPNAAMLRCTHSSAAIWSRRPRLVSNGCSGSAYSVTSRNPNGPNRYWMVTTTTSWLRARWVPS